jgi:hypothetical protein
MIESCMYSDLGLTCYIDKNVSSYCIPIQECSFHCLFATLGPDTITGLTLLSFLVYLSVLCI